MKMIQRATRIKFHDKEYVLIGDMVNGGEIATKYNYENARFSYARLQPDGTITRFVEQIGTVEDIEDHGEIELCPTDEAMRNVLIRGSFLWN